MPLRKKMPLSQSVLVGPQGDDANTARRRGGLWPLTGYFLTLGTFGFGGPVDMVTLTRRHHASQ